MLSRQEKIRDIAVLGGMTLAVGALVLCAYYFKGWEGAFAWGFGFFAFYVLYAWIAKDTLMWRFIAFATVAGFVELIADWWLVVYTKTLIYPPGEPMIWESPAYMPFAWVVVLIQVGYIGFMVHKRTNLKVATIAVGVLGCIIIPFYEFLAMNAGWWDYVNAPTWGIVPKYIFIAEGLLMLTIPDLFDRSETASPQKIVFLGTAQGLVMWVACMIAYFFTG
jgi:hypothetical protein